MDKRLQESTVDQRNLTTGVLWDRGRVTCCVLRTICAMRCAMQFTAVLHYLTHPKTLTMVISMEPFPALDRPGDGSPEPCESGWLKHLLDAEAPLVPVPCIPDIVAPRCHNLTRVWEAAEAAVGNELDHAPFWATPWPGGIALARWILDHQQRFPLKSAVDLGCGSGISGIAAARAGARVLLNDVDSLALSVARITARINHVIVDFLLRDLQGPELENYDIILVGDGFYERTRAARLTRILENCVAHGCTVLAADAGRHIVDLPGRCVFQLEVPVKLDIEGQDSRLASVYLLEP